MPHTHTIELSSNDGLKNFQKEINIWKKKLNSRMDENVGMKNMLGNLLKNNYHKNYLEEMEEFQNNFIREDEVTAMLRNDVTKFDDFSYAQVFKDEKMRESCKKRLDNLRNDIIQSENNFCSLMSSFDDFVYKIYS